MTILFILLAAGVALLLGGFFYAPWIARMMGEQKARITPAVAINDGRDYVPTKTAVVFAHHFASIAGAGPIIGPVLAMLYGWGPALAVDRPWRGLPRRRARFRVDLCDDARGRQEPDRGRPAIHRSGGVRDDAGDAGGDPRSGLCGLSGSVRHRADVQGRAVRSEHGDRGRRCFASRCSPTREPAHRSRMR